MLALIGAVLLGLSCWEQRGQRDDEEGAEMPEEAGMTGESMWCSPAGPCIPSYRHVRGGCDGQLTVERPGRWSRRGYRGGGTRGSPHGLRRHCGRGPEFSAASLPTPEPSGRAPHSQCEATDQLVGFTEMFNDGTGCQTPQP